MSGASGLERLAAELAEEQRLYRYPEQEWVLPREPRPGAERHVDVLIVGAGQAGITAAAQLQRQRITDVTLIDRKPRGLEGPWSDWARMATLRSPKELHGPDAGFPSATFQRWFEAQHGAEAYAALTFIPKADWHAYLLWLRDRFDLETRNETELASLEWAGDRWRLGLRAAGGSTAVWEARKVVLATGLDGLGGIRVPELLDALPSDRWSRANEPLPDAQFAGRSIGVLGGGASAYDNAAHAAEHGAARVVQFQRSRPEQQSVPLRSLEYAGLFQNLRLASDEVKLRFARRYFRSSVPAPDYTVARCLAQPAYELHQAEPWETVRERSDGKIEVRTAGGDYLFDHLIICTGFRIALDAQPFLRSAASGIRTWADRFGWAAGEEPYLSGFPLLDGGFRAQAKDPARAAEMSALHFFSLASDPSLGPVASGVNGLPWGGRILAEAISADLFLQDADRFAEAFEAFAG